MGVGGYFRVVRYMRAYGIIHNLCLCMQQLKNDIPEKGVYIAENKIIGISTFLVMKIKQILNACTLLMLMYISTG